MPDDDNKILKYVTGKKSINKCQNDRKKSYTEKKAVHKALGYSLITCCSFDKSEDKRKYYRGKDCMKMFRNDLKE